jgi:cytochrome c553
MMPTTYTSPLKPGAGTQMGRVLMGLALLFLPLGAHSAPPPAEATSCLACHGAAGQGLAAAGYPRLAGLSSEYIADQLNAYANGSRVNAIMSGMAKPLNAAQIQTVANFFSALPAPTQPVAPLGGTANAALGQQLAERGDWNAGIPACFNCHAPGGIGIPPYFPPIVGQPAAYIEAQINAWKDGTRHADTQNMANTLMHAVSTHMSASQTQAVAAWLAAQNPTPPSAHPAAATPTK